MTDHQTARWLAALDQVLILTHRRPDGDTIGCASALCLALRQLGKTAWVLPNEDAHGLFTPYLEGVLAPAGFLPQHVVAVDVASLGMLPDSAGAYKDRIDLVIDHHGQTSVPDIYGAGDVTGRSPIWPAAVKQGMTAADNMAGVQTSMEDFFASKSTMNFLGIPTMSLGVPEIPDETYTVVMEDNGEQYRKIIHKNGKIYGAILQGDLSYGGVLTQLIAKRIDVSRVKKPLFEIDYSDFFHTKENFEFYYEET